MLNKMRTVKCEIVRWASSEPMPGVVEAELTDRHGRTFRFRDKVPIITTQRLAQTSRFPVPGELRSRFFVTAQCMSLPVSVLTF